MQYIREVSHSRSSTSNSKRTEWAGPNNCRSLSRITEDTTRTEWAMAKFAEDSDEWVDDTVQAWGAYWKYAYYDCY